jgi:glycosyltransferase involved in cell wall biosynthesis
MLREKTAEADFVVTISEFNRRLLARFGDPAKVHVVRCGIELERYPLQEEPPPGPATILTVASLQEYKGVDRLIRACAVLAARSLPEWRCRIVGGGVLRRELERLVEELGLGGRVELCGPKPQDEVARLLQESHLFVLPSVVAHDGQMDGLPVALMEALAVGLPVVASDLSGVPELVRPGETGTLVPPGDAEALADALAGVLLDPEPARRLGRAGRRLVEEQFVLSDNVGALVELFRGGVQVEVPVG